MNEQETLLVSLDIDFKRLMIFSLLEKKRLSSWEYNIKGVEDSKSFTMCCSFDKKLILIGGEAGDLMQKTPLVTLHHFTEKMELIDMLVITGQRDPIMLQGQQPRQRRRKDLAIAEFRQGCRAIAHGSAAIQENRAAHIGLFVKFLDVKPVRPAIAAPIHKARIIPLRIRSVLRKLHRHP